MMSARTILMHYLMLGSDLGELNVDDLMARSLPCVNVLKTVAAAFTLSSRVVNNFVRVGRHGEEGALVASLSAGPFSFHLFRLLWSMRVLRGRKTGVARCCFFLGKRG